MVLGIGLLGSDPEQPWLPPWLLFCCVLVPSASFGGLDRQPSRPFSIPVGRASIRTLQLCNGCRLPDMQKGLPRCEQARILRRDPAVSSHSLLSFGLEGLDHLRGRPYVVGGA